MAKSSSPLPKVSQAASVTGESYQGGRRGARLPSWSLSPLPAWSQLIGITAALLAATLWVYLPVTDYGFVNWDDPAYVEDNPMVRGGLTVEGVQWALTTGHASNWHPLTWLSLMLDVELFGVDPGAMHGTNLLLHAVATVLLFVLLLRLLGRPWTSGLVAALFALHPLHVESVAWIAERKDVLSAVFWWAATWAWVEYVARPSRRRYGLAALLFAAGLMSKPMLVTWPFTLFLLDLWPLRRASLPTWSERPWAQAAWLGRWRPLVVEKLPFFALVALSSAVTFFVQRAGGAVSTLEHVPTVARMANAAVAYAVYLGKMLWPVDLALLYPHPGYPEPWLTAISAILLAGLTYLFLGPWRGQGRGLVGWLFYFGTLVPVIGLVQVGAQAYADRYTYIPLTGIFLLAVGWAEERIRKSPSTALRRGAALSSLLLVALLAWLARGQVTTWSSSEAVFRHALTVTQDNHRIHNVLGVTLLSAERLEEAEQELRRAVGIKPGFADAWNNLGVSLSRQQRAGEAAEAFGRAAALDPADAEARSNLGNVLGTLGRPRQALAAYGEALEIDPDALEARRALALTLIDLGRWEPAQEQLGELLRRFPEDADAHRDLGNVVAGQGRLEEALGHYQRALELAPELSGVRENRAQILARSQRWEEAAAAYGDLVARQPQNAQWRFLLAMVELAAGRPAKAEEQLPALRQLDPTLAQQLMDGLQQLPVEVP
ncbi:MAG: tetratricopeptide repeat protein [Acidobacteriota bacterium]